MVNLMTSSAEEIDDGENGLKVGNGGIGGEGEEDGKESYWVSFSKEGSTEPGIEAKVPAMQHGIDQINKIKIGSAHISHSFSEAVLRTRGADNSKPNNDQNRRASASSIEPDSGGAITTCRGGRRTLWRRSGERRTSVLASVFSMFKKAKDQGEEDKFIPLPESTTTLMHMEPVNSLPFLVSIMVAARPICVQYGVGIVQFLGPWSQIGGSSWCW